MHTKNVIWKVIYDGEQKINSFLPLQSGMIVEVFPSKV